MSKAEIRAHHLFNTMHLGTIDEEVKRHLVILLMKVPSSRGRRSFSSVVKGLSGAWNESALTAEDEVEDIYKARTTDRTREIVNL